MIRHLRIRLIIDHVCHIISIQQWLLRHNFIEVRVEFQLHLFFAQFAKPVSVLVGYQAIGVDAARFVEPEAQQVGDGLRRKTKYGE